VKALECGLRGRREPDESSVHATVLCDPQFFFSWCLQKRNSSGNQFGLELVFFKPQINAQLFLSGDPPKLKNEQGATCFSILARTR
jgi:hypothetical protein